MMKHRLLALLLLILTGAARDASAQDYPPVPVTISRSQVNIDGKTYFAHVVLDRQTIFGISKAYGVTAEDLYNANPLLAREGLKAGTVLYIPVASEPKQNGIVSAMPVPEKEQPAPKEDKPAAESTPSGQDSTPEGFIKHTVRWFEDIYDIASTYDVTVQDIVAANGLKSKRVSKRQILLIPVTEQARNSLPKLLPPAGEPAGETPAPSEPAPVVPEPAGESAREPAGEQPDAVETAVPEPSEGILDWLSGLTGKGSAEFALVLPFNAAGKASETNMDFYSGVLMALRDLESEGVKTTLNVFDLQAGIPSSFDLGKNDFILGPITGTDLRTILGVTGGRVPVISPLDQRAGELAETQEGIIQAPSSVASQYTELAVWAAEERAPGDKIILVTENTPGGTTAPAAGVRSALLASGTDFDSVSLTLAEGQSLPNPLSSALTHSGVNRIIVASETETFVSDLVRNLGILLGKDYQIVLYAPSRVRTFETIDSSNYHQCFLHICSPYFADYDAADVKAFVRSYRSLFRTEPSQFAFQGYDLTRYFAGLAAKYGSQWTRALGHVDGSGIHTDFHFEPARTGSFRNTAIRRIVYKTNYSTELVR